MLTLPKSALFHLVVIDMKDLNVLKKSITDIVNKSGNCMERHSVLEVFLIIK